MQQAPPPAPASSSSSSFVRSVLLPELHDPAFPQDKKFLVALRVALYSAPLLLALPFPQWGLTWVTAVVGLASAALLLAYVRSAANLSGIFAPPAERAARVYYYLVLALALALALAPVAHAFDLTLPLRLGLALAVAAAVLLGLAMHSKILRPGLLGTLADDPSPLGLAQQAWSRV